MAIKTPIELKQAIAIAIITPTDTKEYFDIIWDIHKYKWYNWYQNMHIKKDGDEDRENTMIFNQLERDHPLIHLDIERNIDFELEKMVKK